MKKTKTNASKIKRRSVTPAVHPVIINHQCCWKTDLYLKALSNQSSSVNFLHLY